MNTNTPVMDKIIATQARGCGCWHFGVFDTLEQAKKHVAEELELKALDDFMIQHYRDVGQYLFFETVGDYVASYEQNGDAYDPSGADGFRDREHLIQTVLDARGF